MLLSAFLILRASAQLPGEGHETESIGKPNDYTKLLAESFPPGTRVENIRVPMRDGVKLATDVFIPPGAGPFPVLFSRGYYGRLNSTKGARGTKDGGLVFVVQDCRSVFDSEGTKGRPDLKSADFEMNDCQDALQWIAKQPWCDGKIGMVGASGNGINPSVAYLVKNPNLVITSPSISTGYPYYYWGFNNGVRRGLYSWLRNTSFDTNPWPKPTLPGYDVEKWDAIVAAAAKDNSTILVTSSGWYDICSEAVLDQFQAFAATGKVFARISPNAHAGNPLYPWPSAKTPTGTLAAPKIWDFLLGKVKAPARSQLIYYVLGNFRDPSSPGNFQKITDVWPVPNTPTPWYFQANGELSLVKPTISSEAENTSMGYDYDPKNPAPSLGGNYTYLAVAGPMDQRPLLERKDLIHFVSAPLQDNVQITGKVRATLYVSTDVPDTTFIVKFTDIHPDGYEMIVREGAAMGRNAVEIKGRKSLEKGNVYRLEMDLWSTAIVLAKGHKLGVIVTSSSKDAFEVHPNSFEPVSSYDNSPIAHQKIHFSAEHPSCITLPVVPFDSTDWGVR
ncbi:MAG: CocE/NonD family hydrolase [Candidatus Methylacidiphilales bacterium]|nr:CocE/NonD family hydrolase [Candidatus Methylacidiphilales bacterium]